jgi:Na+/proline symporter
MPLLQKSIQLLGKPMPKVITPKGHAFADYGIAALFFMGAALFWKRNRRAAIASLVCGAAEAAVAATTDSPGGLQPRISFASRQKIDLGLSAMTASMPEFLAFEDEKEKGFFRLQSMAMAGVAVLTEFEPARSREEKKAA